MKLFLLKQCVNNDYDTFDSCVVCANDEDDARNIHPSNYITHIKNGHWMGTYDKSVGGGEYDIDDETWVQYSDIHYLKVTEIGIANESQVRGVICASFNAG